MNNPPHIIALITITLLAACQPASPPETEENPLLRPPIDSGGIGWVGEAATWSYQRDLMADLDGSGQLERVILAADISFDDNGEPLLDHGEWWAVWVESADRQQTLLYGAFVGMGFVEAAVLAADEGHGKNVLIRERGNRRVRTFEIKYHGPGVVQLSSAESHDIDQWLPGTSNSIPLAGMP